MYYTGDGLDESNYLDYWSTFWSDFRKSHSCGMCGNHKDRLPIVNVSAKDDLTCSFNFIVTLNQYTFGFASVSGISMEREVNFIQEGGVNDHQLMVGCPQGSGGYKLDFSRGLMLREPSSTFNIADAIAASTIGNSIARKTALIALTAGSPQQTLEKGPAIGTIHVYNRENKLKAIYSFLSLGMTSWSGGDLSADGTGFLIESISIVHTGLTRVPLTFNSVPYVPQKPDHESQALREQFLKKIKEDELKIAQYRKEAKKRALEEELEKNKQRAEKIKKEKEAKKEAFLEELKKRKQRAEKIKEEIKKRMEEEAEKRKEADKKREEKREAERKRFEEEERKREEENKRKIEESKQKAKEHMDEIKEKAKKDKEKREKAFEEFKEKLAKEAERRKEADKEREEKREEERKLNEEREEKQKEENKKKIEESKQKAQEHMDEIKERAKEDKEKREKSIEESKEKREQKAKEVAKEREERSKEIYES